MDEELLSPVQGDSEATIYPSRQDISVPTKSFDEDSFRLAQDPTYTPDRKELRADDDYLFLAYPSKKDAITEARVRGYSDDTILKRLAQYEGEMLLRKEPSEVNSFFGRTDESESRRKRYMQMNRIEAISKVTGLEPKETYIRTQEAEAVGVNPEAFFADEEFYRMAKSSGIIKERMSIAQNIANGIKISKLRDERGALYYDNLFHPSDGAAKRIGEIDKEIAKLSPPAYNPGLKQAFFDTAGSVASWVDKRDLWAAGVGLAAGALAAPFLVPAGVVTGTVATGATALATARIAYDSSMLSRMFLRESAEFNEDMAKDGVPQYAALPASFLYGAVSAGIERNMFSGVLSSFGEKIGGDMIMDYLRRYGKRAVKGLAAHPAVASKLEKLSTAFMAKQAAKNPTVSGALKTGALNFAGRVWDEDVEEMMQEAASIIIGEPLKMLTLPEYDHMTLEEAFANIAGAGLEALPSITLMMTPGSAYSTVGGVKRAVRYRNSAEGIRTAAAEKLSVSKNAEEPVVISDSIAADSAEDAVSAARDGLIFLGQDAVDTFFQSNPEAAGDVAASLGITEDSVINELGEIAVKRENFVKTVTEHPEFAKSVDMDVRDGARGVTKREAAERLNKKLQDPLEQNDSYANEAAAVRREITSELREAGMDDEASVANADLYSRYLYTLGKRLDMSPKELHRLRVESRDADAGGSYYQPVNEDVDPDARVSVVDLSKAYDGTHYSGVQELKNKIREMTPLKITAADNKAVVEILRKHAEHLAHSSAPSDVTKNVPALRKVAFDNLSDIVSASVLIESMKNEKIIEVDPSWPRSRRQSANRKNKVAFYHRLYVPITVDGETYKVIRLVAEENKNGDIVLDPRTVELYDVIIEDKNARLSASPENRFTDLPGGARLSATPDNGLADLPGLSLITIKEMLSGVKDNDGTPYFQSDEHGGLYQSIPQGKRGGITFNRNTGEALVTLFRTADRSTFIHEMGHLILDDLIHYGYKAEADTEISSDLKTVLDYLGVSDMDLSDLNSLDDSQRARLTEAHEKWARAMETYVMTGEAPSNPLRSIFKKMRMWLLEIYSNAKFAGEEITPEVQDVFDRLLATPQEIDESYASDTSVSDLVKEIEILKQRLLETEKQEKYEQRREKAANDESYLGRTLISDLLRRNDRLKKKIIDLKGGKEHGKRSANFKVSGFDYETKTRRETMFERLEKRKALLNDIDELLNGINRDVNDEKVIWSVQLEMLAKLKESRQIVDLRDTELDKKRSGRRRRKSKFAAVYPTERMKMAASLMESIREDLGFDYRKIDPKDTPFMKMIEKLEASGMTLNDLRLSDAKLSEIAALAKEINEIHARGRREYEVWRAGIVERRNKIRAECAEDLAKTESKIKKGPVSGAEDLSKQYDGILGRAEKVKDWTYANTLGAIRLFDWIGHGQGKFNSAFSKHCVDEVNAAYDAKLRHIHERHDAMNEKMKSLGITLHDLSKKRRIGKYERSVDELLSIYTAMQNDKSSQALIYGNMRNLIPDEWFIENAKAFDAPGNDVPAPEAALAHIGECIKALTPKEKELADYVVQEYDANYERMNDIFIANFNQGMLKEENYTPMHRLEYTSNHGLENADEAAYARGIAEQAGARKAGLERGFLNPRVIPGKEIGRNRQAPIQLGLLSIWNTQVDAMEHTAAFAQIGPDLHSVFTENFDDLSGRSYNLPKLIREKFGRGTWKAVETYINLVNSDRLTQGKNVFEDLSNFMGTNMAYTYLAANLGTVLKQTTSIPRFIVTAGPAELANAVAEYVRHPKQFLEDIYAMDPQMRDRLPNVFFGLNKYDPTVAGSAKYAYKKTMETLIAPISYMDRVVAAIGWKATFDSNIKKKLSREQAIRAAQRAVLLTQQTPMLKDAPMIWRQSGLARLMMIFTSDAAPLLGMTAYDMAQAVKRGDHPEALWNITACLVCAVAMKAIVDGMPDDDNDESWTAWVLSAFTKQTVESIPLVGKELMSFWESFSGQGYNGTTYSAFVAPISKILKGYEDVTSEDSDEVSKYTGMTKFERGIWNTVEGMSLITAPFPVVGAKRLYLAAKEAGDGNFLRALQTIIGQRKKIKRYAAPLII